MEELPEADHDSEMVHFELMQQLSNLVNALLLIICCHFYLVQHKAEKNKASEVLGRNDTPKFRLVKGHHFQESLRKIYFGNFLK